MATLILTVGAVSLRGFPGEPVVLFTFIALLIAKELFDARPDKTIAEGSGRAFYLATVPLTLIFAAIIAARFIRF
jgi:hypothetical protein